jgi:fluoroquinolone resistance protein
MDTRTHEEKSFRNATLSEEDRCGAEYSNCSFYACDFSNSVFAGTMFVDCVFDNCNLSMAKLTSCIVNNAVFKNCKVLGVNFGDCADFPFDVRFEGCTLDYCSFARKKMPKTSFLDTSMKNVDFTETDLTKSVFSRTNLMNAVFHRTVLREANLTTAVNYIIDPEANNVRKAIFSLQGVAGLLNKYDIVVE